MNVSNYANVRQNFSTVIEEVVETDQPLVITKKDLNVVMISLDRFNFLERQARNNEYVSMLQHSYQQAVAGEVVAYDLVEVD